MEKSFSFPITGMYCVNCARGVEKEVRTLAFVKSAEVNPATQTLYVVMAPGKERVWEIIEAIRNAGFDVLASTLRVHIAGLNDPAHTKEIEAALASIDGVLEIENPPASEELLIDYIPGMIGPRGIAQAIRNAGFLPELDGEGGEGVSAFDVEVDARIREYYDQRIKFRLGLLFTIPLLVLSIGRNSGALGAGGESVWLSLLLWALATPVLFYTGADYFKRGWSSLRDQSSNLDVLVILGTSVAYFYSILVIFFPKLGPYLFFDIAAVVIVLVKLGKLLETRLRGKSSATLMKLKDLAPTKALLLRDGLEEKIAVHDIRPGDLLVIHAGDSVPVDGIVVEGSGSVDESTLTGESLPVDKNPEDWVLGGTLNKSGRLVFRAEKVGRDTMLARIIRMVREAQGRRPSVQAQVDEVAAIFIPAVILFSIFVCLIWIFMARDFTAGFTEGMIRLIAILVIACPAALGLAAPTAIMAATGRAVEQGILFKTGQAFEDAALVDTVVFNKTGTITYGRPELTDTIIFDENMSGQDLLMYAAPTEKNSDHPLGIALQNKAKELNLTLPETEDFINVGGSGVKSLCQGHAIMLGRPGWFTDEGILDMEKAESEIQRLRGEGKTVLCMAVDGVLKGLFGLADTPRSEMPGMITRLKTMGITPVLVTGDNRQSAEAVARFCGIEKVFSHVRPEGKVETVKQLQDSGKRVAVVGDGVNDAPAIAAANLGIIMGRGSDVALETGDVVLTMGKTGQVPVVFALGRASMRVIRKNLFWALCYNVTLIPLAGGILAPFLGLPDMLRHLNPMIGALAMVLGSLNVLWNSLRLYRSKEMILREEEGGMPPIKLSGNLTRWGTKPE
ncbi:heavy metal translocating P-type ATPase [Desulfococcaceae bacterium OttesenSCG-928-F15]|nr:heavy metal translocating P-type ATPase [Desulfococcaceae bacterium OttesenSCG-928-F15]